MKGIAAKSITSELRMSHAAGISKLRRNHNQQSRRYPTRTSPSKYSGPFLSTCQVANRGMENTAFDSADLERVAGQLAAGFDINEHTLVNELSAEEKSVTTGSPVRLSRVSTFIMGAKDDRYSFGYIVSSIGSHWGVVVGEGEDVFFCHLIVENRADIASDANPDSITGKVRAVTVKPSRSVFSASFVKTASRRLIVGLLRTNPPWYPR